MKDDTQETSRGRYFQYAVFALAALLVLSLGFVLIPREPPPPVAPPFSEQARAQAFADSLALRASALGLEGAAGATATTPQAAALARVVTLLTVHAKALMLPADGAGSNASAPPPSAPVAPPSTVSGLAAALQASGVQRLKDAETADGGMARLLAGAGTAQLLAAEDLAPAAGIALAPLPLASLSGSALPGGAGTDPDDSPTPSCSSGSRSPAADLGAALVSALEGELELVYAYQAALTRLNPASVAPASDFLARHGVLRDQAEAMSRSRCAALPPRQPGYVLGQAFLADPAAGLGTLEAGTLPVWGDVVAHSEGSHRTWALSALQSAARRTVCWGAPPGPVPGVVLDESLLPQLSEEAPAPGPPTTGSRPPGNS
ncbi:MAG TPA: ferritin-like domain-containing protein [Arthrobacter sp.]|nr:ferritin-like domain-containing protein [Arthrobacter sp.]